MSLRHASSQGRLVDSFGREVQEKEREEPLARGGANANGTKQTIVESLLPSLQRRNGPRRTRPSDAHHHPPSHRPHAARPPMPPAPQLTVSSRWYSAQALYTCRVVHECDPPGGVEYYGLQFFKLFLGDVYEVVKEAGHPSQHRDLPLLVDEGEDCLLLARDSSGELGWLLASFLFPVD